MTLADGYKSANSLQSDPQHIKTAFVVCLRVCVYLTYNAQIPVPVPTSRTLCIEMYSQK
jgi:hypothetical protein